MNIKSINRMRKHLQEMFINEDKKSCMYEVLRLEGFLPETITEGESYENLYEQLSSDDYMIKEMYEACGGNLSECGVKLREWFDEVDHMKENDDEDGEDMATYLKKRQMVLDTEVMSFEKKLKAMVQLLAKLNVQDINNYYNLDGKFTFDGLANFVTKLPEESAAEYYNRISNTGDFVYRKVLIGLINPRNRGFIVKHGKAYNPETMEMLEDLLSDIFDISNAIYLRLVDTKKDSDSSFEKKTSTDDDNFKIDKKSKQKIDFMTDISDLAEDFKPLKGKNVDNENKINANKENKEAIAAADKTQKTIDQKVDNLKNQKHELNTSEKNTSDMLNGFRNSLDLDYSTDLSDEEKKRIQDLAVNKQSKDTANVDHDSTVNQDLVDAAEERNKAGVTKKDYTSSVDATSVEDRDVYQKTTAVSEEVKRMKRLFNDPNSEMRKKKLDENAILFNHISTKKFI